MKRIPDKKLKKEDKDDLKKLYDNVDECVKLKTAKGMPPAQARVECEKLKKEITVKDLAFSDSAVLAFTDIVAVEKVSRLNNIIKFPVTLAAEMIQNYHISEFPEAVRPFFGDRLIIPIFKPFEELEKAISSVNELPIIVGDLHPSEIFISAQSKSVIGSIKDLRADPSDRSIKGFGYANEGKVPETLLSRIKSGEAISVSIGGITNFGGGGKFNDKDYILKQVDIKLGHLLLIPNGKGRCPPPICGANLDSAENSPEKQGQISESDGDQGRLFRRFFLVTDASQADPEIPTIFEKGVLISEADQITPNSKTNKKEFRTMPDEKDIKIKELEDQVASLKDKDFTSLQDELTASKAQIKVITKEKDDIQVKLTDTEAEHTKVKAKLDAINAKEIITIRDALLKTKLYTEEELKDSCLHDLQVMQASTVKALENRVALGDANIKAFGLVKPSEEERKEPPKQTTKLGDASADFNDPEVYKKFQEMDV